MTSNSKHIAIEAIKKKLLGKKLTYREIFSLMDEISHRRINNILTTYFVAASFKEGFSDDELYSLTKAMVETGKTISFEGIVADKHSTGGVAGTRTTMIVVPIIASAGFKIPKLSSRAITSPAGTADVMEVLAPVTFTTTELKKIVENVGGCVVWNGNMGIAPADDIIIKIEEPLSFESFDKIIVSIMAKKIAVGTTHLVLDIPVGPTMKIKHQKDAEKVVEKFKRLGRRFKIKIEADISNTYEPAAYGIGPTLEARDVMLVLEQNKHRSMMLEEKAIRLAGKLLDMCYREKKINKNGHDEAKKILTEGIALNKFKEIIKAQGGNEKIRSDDLLLKLNKHNIIADVNGNIQKVNNFNINSLAKMLGAPDDKKAGIKLIKKIGDKITKNDVLAEFYSSDKYLLNEAIESHNHLPIYFINEK